MKKIILIAFAIFTLSAFQQSQAQRVGVSIDFNTFYSDLSPYGRWVDYPEYGRVWVNNEQGFRPYYSNGHWVYTDYGWTWVSDYPWGWAPFHYGRWVLLSGYGWAWVPGYEWAPAWVSWSGGSDYYGWAPLSPGPSLSVSFRSIPADRWVFVPRRYITSPSIHNYYIDQSRNTTIIRNTTVINNIKVNNGARYHAGPQRTEVERVAQTRIQPVAVHDAPAPGKTTVNNRALNIYRPQIRKNPASAETNANRQNRQNVPVTKKPVQNNNVPQQQQVLKQKQQIQEQQTHQQKVKVQDQQKHNEVVQQQQEQKRIQQQRDLEQQRNQQTQQQHQQQMEKRQQEKVQQQRSQQVEQQRSQRNQQVQQPRNQQVQQPRNQQMEQHQQGQFVRKGEEKKRHE